MPKFKLQIYGILAAVLFNTCKYHTSSVFNDRKAAYGLLLAWMTCIIAMAQANEL
jgi:O-antigen ligase